MEKKISSHVPVLTKELLSYLSPALKKKPLGEVYWALDGTFGGGGHARLILEHFANTTKLIALDVDKKAIDLGKKHFKKLYPERVFFTHKNFYHYLDLDNQEFSCIINNERIKNFQCIVLDLGLSTMQLEDKDQGFSLYKQGPLDMRLDLSHTKIRAKDLVNRLSEKELLALFKDYVRQKGLRRVVRQIQYVRKKTPFQTTKDLADLIEKKMGWRKKGKHPATNFFLALRVKVNNELEGLEKVLPNMIKSLRAGGGRLLVISFHSLEDRVVKKAFLKEALEGKGKILTKKPITPSYKERKKNPRSRSAKLRVFEKF